MEYPIFIKSTNDYIMYKYRGSGALEISAIDYDFKQMYIGYGRQQAVRLFRQALKESAGK
jgi:hypothetical protein